MGNMLGDDLMAISTAVVIEDYMFDSSVVGELTPEESPSDFNDAWDLDGTDFTPEASPDDEGYWDDFSNMVTNGGFDADTGWTKGTGWTISGGKANFDGSSTAFLQQDPSSNGIVVGNAYEVTFTVSGYVSGAVRSSLGGYSHGSAVRSANGTYTEIITVTESGANDSFYLHASSVPGEFSIDNFTVTEYAITPLDV